MATALCLMKRILLKSFDTGLYLEPSGTWTNRPELAQEFPDTVAATEVKVHRGLKGTFAVVMPRRASRPRLAVPRKHEAQASTARAHQRLLHAGRWEGDHN